ncbi:MAG: class I SAM-dependent methyltransferase, partial [Candidatus Rokuibacteriota bacterium]
MIVEFVGFPGSGKTSIVRRIVRSSAAIDSVVVAEADSWELARYPVVAARQLPLWWSLRKEWPDGAALWRLLSRRAAQEAVRAPSGSMVILEEGITHHVWRDLMLAPGLRDSPWAPLLSVGHPLVVLDAGDRTLHQRIAGKTETGVVNAGLASLSIDGPEWQQARTFYDRVITQASQYRRVLRVCTDGDQEEAIARVRFAIAAHFGLPDGADAMLFRETRRRMPSLGARLAATYRSKGVSGLVRAAQRRLAPSPAPDPMDADYQEKVAGSLQERWQKIEEAIPDGCRTALDIGCNLGDITALCAQKGLWAIGVDQGAKLIAEAHRRHRDVVDCGFMRMTIAPPDIERFPTFDVVLVLSVLHHWLMDYGPDVAGQMLRSLAERTGRVLIFEGAARRVRYGDYSPDFIDNDEATVTAYLESYLRAHVGDVFSD